MAFRPEIIGAAEINEFFAAIQDRWNPLPLGSFAAVLRGDDGQIVAITAVYPLFAAGGSWVRPDLRGNGLSRLTRRSVEAMLRKHGENVYVSFPRNEEEHAIFASYGGYVSSRQAQVKGL